MATVTEMGLSPANVANVEVYWGGVTTQNTPTPAVGAPPAVPLPGYGAPLKVAIDGVMVNLEHLLIRFVITQLGVGGTVSNNLLAGAPYPNPTANNMTVQLTWAGGGFYAAGTHAATWQPGGVGW